MLDLPSLTRHLIELRKHLLRCLILFVLVALILMPFANQLYYILSRPLLNLLPPHSALIATALPAVFFIPLKFALFTALILCLPFFLREFSVFVLPALYQHEKRWLRLIVFSNILFYLGMLFAYFIVFPLLITFFLQTTPLEVNIMPDISSYYDLMMQLLFAFGMAFQVPVIIIVLVSCGISEINTFVKLRRYFIILAFVLGMLVTPPDVVSQSLFAVPLCLLFELGLLLARMLKPTKIKATV